LLGGVACAEEALDEIEELDRRLSLFRRDSFLSFVNRSAFERAVRVDPELFGLFLTCRDVWQESDGAFDITVGRLMQTWGFHEGSTGAAGSTECERQNEPLGFHHVVLDEDACTVRFSTRGMRLDLGGVAKGFALEQAASLLREQGLDRALLHGGTSTVAAIGHPLDQDAWKVGIRMPGNEEQLAARALLCDSALSVSAPHGRTQDRDGKTCGHVMDPASAAPAQEALLAAVVATSATRADAWSTALLAAGPGRFEMLVSRAKGVRAALILAGTGAIALSGPEPELFEC
jgi:thiamine biosynthesis lipoprotein